MFVSKQRARPGTVESQAPGGDAGRGAGRAARPQAQAGAVRRARHGTAGAVRDHGLRGRRPDAHRAQGRQARGGDPRRDLPGRRAEAAAHRARPERRARPAARGARLRRLLGAGDRGPGPDHGRDLVPAARRLQRHAQRVEGLPPLDVRRRGELRQAAAHRHPPDPRLGCGDQPDRGELPGHRDVRRPARRAAKGRRRRRRHLRRREIHRAHHAGRRLGDLQRGHRRAAAARAPRARPRLDAAARRAAVGLGGLHHRARRGAARSRCSAGSTCGRSASRSSTPGRCRCGWRCSWCRTCCAS